MRNIEDNISLFVKNQFPAFYQEEGPGFVEFVKQYYKYLEDTNNPLYLSRNLIEYRDIDKSLDSFIVHFKEKYLKYFPYEIAVEDTRFLIKHVMDFYRSKGSERSYEIFFRSVYNATPTLYYPKEDLFKLSDGTWYKPVYLEVKKNSVDLNTLVQKTVIGSSSLATAFVEAITTKRISGKYTSVVYLSGVVGTFQAGEVLTIQDLPIIEGYPLILGSLSSVDVITGGENFAVGDLLRITTGTGRNGILRVTSIATETGVVRFTIEESGFGFTNTSAVLVSQKVLDLDASSNGYLFKTFNTITQPQSNIEFNTANATLSNGQMVVAYYANGWLAGNGTIIATNQDGANGTILVSTHSGNVANGASGILFISNGTANTAQLVIDTYTDVSATANLIGQNTTSIGVINVHNAYVNYPGNRIIGDSIELQGNVAITHGSNVVTGTNTLFERELSVGDTVILNTFRYEVDAITSNTSIRLSSDYDGDTDTGQTITLSGYESSVQEIGLGSGATFSLGPLGNPESVRLDSTFLADRNVGNVPHMSVRLDASNANTGSGYGFIKYPGGDKDAILLDCFEIDDYIIGSIESLVSVDGGQEYTKPPFVRVYERRTAGHDRRDWIFNIENATQNFAVGEIIEQTTQDPSIVLTVSSLGGNTTALEVGEFVYQSNGSANVATGLIYSASIDELGDGFITLIDTDGTFTSSYQIATLTSGANSDVDNVDIDTIDITGRGIIKEGSNTDVLYVKRITFFNTFRDGETIVGVDTGATANIFYVVQDDNSLNIGNNALITANVVVANGTVTSVDIYDSGIGYVEDEVVSAVNVSDETSALTVKLHAQTQGVGQGFYKSTGSFISHDKYLHDGDYYQNFSYDIRSKVPFETYKDVLKQVIHVAGTKLFGTYIDQQTLDLTVTGSATVETT